MLIRSREKRIRYRALRWWGSLSQEEKRRAVDKYLDGISGDWVMEIPTGYQVQKMYNRKLEEDRKERWGDA